MKNLNEYIEKRLFLKRITQSFENTFDDFLTVNHINEEDVNENDIIFFMEHCALRNDDVDLNEVKERIFQSLNNELGKVYEMLDSHDVNVVMKALKKEFGDDIEVNDNYKTYKDEKKTIFGIRFNTWQAYEKITRSKTLYEILSKFNYYYTSVSSEHDDGKEYMFMWCEPIYTKKVTDKVEDCGTIYHVCTTQAYQRIMKSGLRPKSGKYRKFEDRVYFVTGDDKNDIKRNLDKVISDKQYNKNDIKVLKIDLKKHPYNIDFYKDTMADEGYMMFYTYAYFPPSWIKDVTDEFYK